MRKKSLIIASSFFLFFVILALTYKTILAYCLTVWVHHQDHAYRKVKVIFRDICFEKGTIRIDGISFSQKEEESEILLTYIEEMRLDYQLSLKPSAFLHSVHLFKPDFFINRWKHDKQERASFSAILDKLDQLPEIHIQEGVMHLQEGSEVSSLSVSCNLKKEADLNLLIEGERREKISITSHQQESKKHVHMSIVNMPLSFVEQLGMSKKLEVKGLIHADLACILTLDHMVEDFSGDVQLSDFFHSNSRMKSLIKMDHAVITFEQLKEKKSFQLDELLSFSLLWKSLEMGLKVDHAEMALTHPIHGSDWKLLCDDAILQLNPCEGTFVKVRGNLSHDGTRQDYELSGHGAIESEKDLWVDLKLKTYQGDKSNEADIFFSVLEDGHYYFKTTLEHLHSYQVESYQKWLSVFFPICSDFTIDHLDVSCDVIVEFKEASFYKLSLDKLEISNFEGFYPAKKTEVSFDHLKGKLRLYNPNVVRQPPSWEVVFDHLKIFNFSHERVALIKDGKGFIQAKEGIFLPSKISATCSGVHIDLNVEGAYDDFQLFLSASHEEDYPFKELEKSVLATKHDLRKIDKLDISTQVKGLFHQPSLNGSLGIIFENNERDSVHFGVNLINQKNDSIFSLDCWKEPKFKGWFQSDSLSEDAYLWMLKLTHQEWNMFGVVNISGEFDHESITFSMETDQGSFDSEDILIRGSLSGKESGVGKFHFDIPGQRWNIGLPLDGASCLIKKFNLVFSELKSDIKIHGAELIASQVSCTSEAIDFEGALNLNFSDPSANILTIFPKSVKGRVLSLQRFLRHIPDLQWMDFPFDGEVTCFGENFFRATYSAVDSHRDIKVGLNIEKGISEINENTKFHEVSAKILWDSKLGFLDVKELEGKLSLQKENFQKDYLVRAPLLKIESIQDFISNFDLRIETPTYDVIRLVGSTLSKDRQLHFHLDESLSHIFNSKIELKSCVLGESFNLKEIECHLEISAQDLAPKLEWAYLGGYLNFSKEAFDELRSIKYEGDISVAIQFNDDLLKLEGKSKAFVTSKMSFEDLVVLFEKREKKYLLKQFKTKQFDLSAEASLKDDVLHFDQLKARFESSHFESKDASFDCNHKKASINFEKAHLCVQELARFFHEDKLLDGKNEVFLDLDGIFSIDYSKGWNLFECSSNLQLNACNLFSEKLLTISTSMPFQVRKSQEGVWQIHRLTLNFSHMDHQELFSLLKVDDVYYVPNENSFECTTVKGLIPPEMLHYLAEAKVIPFLEGKDGHIILYGKELKWDNQIEGCFDVSYKGGNFNFKGDLKEGYYWIANKSLYFKKINMEYYHDQFKVDCGIDYQDLALDVCAKVDLTTEKTVQVIFKEGHIESDLDDRPSLTLLCKESQEEGFYIHSLTGQLYLIDFSFLRNSRSYVPHVMMLTGQMKMDTAGLVKAFPKLFYQTVKDLGMGSGYELSGDWFFSKQDFTSSYFKGFLKGRDFDFMGYHLKTLLSEVEVSFKHILVHDFNLSDQSGVIQMKEAKIEKTGERLSWEVSIPEIHVQDFRPSFLKRSEIDEESLKPFVIKDLYFHGLKGTLGNKESFTGRGHLDFINTFKREYNLLDIPIEIIGRIGFDLGLFVPVRGQLDLDLDHGKLYLQELKNAYSEGKRSRFYLSNNQPSYIDLSGNVMVDIKMKQYVLLKITEPFTLSVRGTVTKPKYSLR